MKIETGVRRARRYLAPALTAILTASGAMGCGDDDDDTTAHDADHNTEHDHTTCGLQENCKDTVTLSEGLEIDGDDGVFSVRVVSHTALSTDANDWTLEVLDAEGNPVANADVTADVFSVDCGHGGPNPAQELTADASGNVDVAPVTAHGGPWDVIVDVSSGGQMDSATFHLCIPGESHDTSGGAAGMSDHMM